MRSPVAFLSYSWADAPAAELLHDELTLRGFDVLQDRHSFHLGDRLTKNMTEAVEHCDLYIVCLTRSSLYLDASLGNPRPVVDSELLPVLARRRRSLGTAQEPIVVPVPLGLGNRADVSETFRRITGEPIDSLWTPIALNESQPQLIQSQAAAIADHAYRAYRALKPAVLSQLFVASRGTAPPSQYLTLNATPLTGGTERRPGTPVDWKRVQEALENLVTANRPAGAREPVEITLNCHLTGGVLIGRAFHQASPWAPTFPTRHGNAAPAITDTGPPCIGQLDQYQASGDLLVDIDLLGHNVTSMASKLATQLPVGGRLSLHHPSTDDFAPATIASLARNAGKKIRTAHGVLRPGTIHLCLAGPVAFAALLGHQLTALHSELRIYEDCNGAYVHALTVSASAF